MLRLLAGTWAIGIAPSRWLIVCGLSITLFLAFAKRRAELAALGERAGRARPLPGPANFMGAVKFMFPNEQGIYLHDTPERDLLAKDPRFFSNGCVRLEAAARLGRWLFGKPLPRSRQPERRVELPVPVPIYITYLTAAPEGAIIRFRPDVYGRDAVRTQVAVKSPR